MLKLNVREEFKKYGIKASFQRVKIFNFLNKAYSHPSVEEIYTELVKDIPTLSKTTVYNNLSLFIEKGLAKEVKIDSYESRYELNRGVHGHFMCEKCGMIQDFEADYMDLMPKDLGECEIRTKNLYFTGLCSACRKSVS